MKMKIFTQTVLYFFWISFWTQSSMCDEVLEKVICPRYDRIFCDTGTTIRVVDAIVGRVVGRDLCKRIPVKSCTTDVFCLVSEWSHKRLKSEYFYPNDAKRHNFSDPCPGKDKYMIIKYMCGKWKYELVGENFALKKPAIQLTTAYGGLALRAVDGDSNKVFSAGHSCTHTDLETTPWWRVDLEQRIAVSHVKITNRDIIGIRLCGFEIRIGDTTAKNGIQNARCGQLRHIPSKKDDVISCEPPLVGRYVTIVIPGVNKILSLCEVKVYGKSVLGALKMTKNVNTTSNSFGLRLQTPQQGYSYIRVIMIKLSDKNQSLPLSYSYTKEQISTENKTVGVLVPYVTVELSVTQLEKYKDFIIGDGRNYEQSPRNKRRQRRVDDSKVMSFYNRPLEAGKSYSVFQRTYQNENVYYSSSWTEPIKTATMKNSVSHEASSSTGLILWLGIAVGLLTLIVIVAIVLFVFVRIRRKRRRQRRRPKSDADEDVRSGDLSLEQVSSYAAKSKQTCDDNVVSLYEELGVRTEPGYENPYQSLATQRRANEGYSSGDRALEQVTSGADLTLTDQPCDDHVESHYQELGVQAAPDYEPVYQPLNINK